MNDLLEVAVFAPGKDNPIYLARHRIRTGRQTIRVVVTEEPSRAGVDPHGKLIERERGNNVVPVQVTSEE
jgi:hypothetical protein